jgi:hypothetical protein
MEIGMGTETETAWEEEGKTLATARVVAWVVRGVEVELEVELVGGVVGKCQAKGGGD